MTGADVTFIVLGLTLATALLAPLLPPLASSTRWSGPTPTWIDIPERDLPGIRTNSSCQACVPGR